MITHLHIITAAIFGVTHGTTSAVGNFIDKMVALLQARAVPPIFLVSQRMAAAMMASRVSDLFSLVLRLYIRGTSAASSAIVASGKVGFSQIV